MPAPNPPPSAAFRTPSEAKRVVVGNAGVDALGKHASRGFIWFFANSVFSKFASLASQIVLARLLLPNDWGLVGLAATVTSITANLSNPGIEDVLVQRQTHLRRYLTAGFWMNTICGLIGTVLTISAAPIGAWAYGRPELFGLIAVGALAATLNNLGMAPRAILRIDLRFGTIALISTLMLVLQSLLAIILAELGWGPYSFVVPAVVAAGVQAAVMWRVSRPRIRRRLQFRRWRLLFRDSANIFFCRMLIVLISQGDYITLGVLHFSATDVGYYYFAYNLSTQVIALITSNVNSVLIPTLTRINHDPRRQLQAVLNAASLLAFVGVPLGLFQAAMATPIVELFFGTKWMPATNLLALLSIGMAVNSACWPAGAVLQAQGRFQTALKLAIFCTVTFAALVVPLTYLYGTLGTAGGVLMYYIITSVIGFAVGIVPTGGRSADILRVYLSPLLMSVVAIGSGLKLAEHIHVSNRIVSDIVSILVTGSASGSIYVILTVIFARPLLKSSMNRVEQALPRQWVVRFPRVAQLFLPRP